MNNSKLSLSSTFNWEDHNMKALLTNIEYSTHKKNDQIEPFCHYNHKNLGTKMAPFQQQKYILYLNQLTNIKYISIDNYTHAAEMNISIAYDEETAFTEVYTDHYVCRGKILKNSNKLVDIGALPCRVIQISVNKGCKISAKNISLIGVNSETIRQKLGDDYFKLLVVNPIMILYGQQITQ